MMSFGLIFIIGFSCVMAAAYAGSAMDKDRASGPASNGMRLFLRYGSGLTAILGFVYAVCGFFVFGWWNLAILPLAYLFQVPVLTLIVKKPDTLPLVTFTLIIFGNALCIVSLMQP